MATVHFPWSQLGVQVGQSWIWRWAEGQCPGGSASREEEMALKSSEPQLSHRKKDTVMVEKKKTNSTIFHDETSPLQSLA